MKRNKGFTLLEILIVVGIVAIITAIAYPAYANHIRRAACDNGKAGLVQAAALMNQYYMQYGKYKNPQTDASNGGHGFEINKLPNNSNGDGDFFVTLSNLTDTSFTLTAKPTATGRLHGVSGELTINEKNATEGQLNGKDVWIEGCNSI